MGDDKERSRMAEGIDIIIDEAKMATSRAYRRSGAETIGESVKEALKGALSSRDNVVMVRLNSESVAKLDELVESGIVNSRSEAAAVPDKRGRGGAIAALRAHRREDGDDQEGQAGAPQPHRRAGRAPFRLQGLMGAGRTMARDCTG